MRGRSNINSRIDDLVCESPAMREVLELVQQVAPTPVTVLLLGEKGTGKELMARTIHMLSPQNRRPFKIARSVEAFEAPEPLKKADNGTLFLDEIGEIDSSAQTKLMRFLKERTFERVGSNKALTVDARVIAATNKNLQDLVKAGTFREDLYYRLSVVEIRMPALRERKEDIVPLAQNYLRRFSMEAGRHVKDFTSDAAHALVHYSWPGNLRQLSRVVEWAVMACHGEHIGVRDLMTPIAPDSLN